MTSRLIRTASLACAASLTLSASAGSQGAQTGTSQRLPDVPGTGLTTVSETPHANGKLQLHFMDVGEGDAAVLISPDGETVLFDNGVFQQCHKPLSYLQQLGVTRIDYQIVSHYHADHIGCTAELFANLPLTHAAFDRGASYHGDVYDSYVAALGNKRQAATEQTTITLEQGSANPVTIRIVVPNSGIKTENEHDLSLVAVVGFGQFKAVLGGDLTGLADGESVDVETAVAAQIGQVDVYKVHGHGSRYSSNTAWLGAVRPRIGIVSTGPGNRYGHPTRESIERLHRAGVKTYWTGAGNGVEPEAGMDVVAGNVIVEVAPNAKSYTVRYTARPRALDEYAIWSAGGTPATPTAVLYSWSKRAAVYHYSSCSFVSNISPDQLEAGAAPPAGKKLHRGCPN